MRDSKEFLFFASSGSCFLDVDDVIKSYSHLRHEVVVYSSPMATPWVHENENRPAPCKGKIGILPLQSAGFVMCLYTQGVAIGLDYIWLTANVEGVKFASLVFCLSLHYGESEGLCLNHLRHSGLLTYVTMWLKNHLSQQDLLL